jgi:hypothetical protein
MSIRCLIASSISQSWTKESRDVLERYGYCFRRRPPKMEEEQTLLSHVVGGRSEGSHLYYSSTLPISAGQPTSRGCGWGEVTSEDRELLTLHLHPKSQTSKSKGHYMTSQSP